MWPLLISPSLKGPFPLCPMIGGMSIFDQWDRSLEMLLPLSRSSLGPFSVMNDLILRLHVCPDYLYALQSHPWPYQRILLFSALGMLGDGEGGPRLINWRAKILYLSSKARANHRDVRREGPREWKELFISFWAANLAPSPCKIFINVNSRHFMMSGSWEGKKKWAIFIFFAFVWTVNVSLSLGNLLIR